MMHGTYGFQVVCVADLINRAMLQPVLDPPEPDEESPPPPQPTEGEPQFWAKEKEALITGQEITTETLIRLVGWALKIEKNIDLVQQLEKDKANAKEVLEK